MVRTAIARPALMAALAAALLAGCQVPGAHPARPQLARPTAWRGQEAPVVRQDAQLLPLPAGADRRLVEVGSGKLFTGEASFQTLAIPFFADSGAYRVAAMALGRTLVTCTTLEEDLFVRSGQAIGGATDAGGRFSIVNAPADRPFVVAVQLAASHRLSALVPAGVSSTRVDEGASMVAEMARWQIRSAPGATAEPGRLTLQDLTATTVAELNAKSAEFVLQPDFAATGAVPSVEALKIGAGHVLRNRYVAAFGSRITAAGATAADWLSDRWRAIIGHRPLALTRVAGNGLRGYNQGDDLPAAQAGLASPIDVADAAGGLVITEQDNHLLRYVPAVDTPGGMLGYGGPMTAGRLYTIGGVLNGPPTIDAFNGFYQPIEAASALDPAEAPPLAVGFPLFTPYRVAAVPDGAGGHHLFFTSKFGHRVFLVPGSGITGRYGRDFLAGRLYTLAGHGEQRFGDPIEADDPETEGFNEDRTDYLYGEGAPAHEASLNQPTGLAVDGAGNVFVLDAGYTENELKDTIASGETDATYTFPNTNAPPGRSILVYHGTIRVIRAVDGRIVTLRLTMGGEPFPVTGAEDMRLMEDGSGNRTLYVADTSKHWVFSVAVPADLTATPLAAEIAPVVGAIGEPGFVRDGVALPDSYRAFDGVPIADARLNAPTSLDFDKDGKLVVADAGTRRVRFVDGGQVYTIAGGFDTPYLEGDARLGYFPQTTAVRLDQAGNLLLVDRKESLVRRVWTMRGTR